MQITYAPGLAMWASVTRPGLGLGVGLGMLLSILTSGASAAVVMGVRR